MGVEYYKGEVPWTEWFRNWPSYYRYSNARNQHVYVAPWGDFIVSDGYGDETEYHARQEYIINDYFSKQNS